MANIVADWIVPMLIRILFFVVLLPVTALLATPIILAGAAIARGRYVDNVKNGYRSVYEFWWNLLPGLI